MEASSPRSSSPATGRSPVSMRDLAREIDHLEDAKRRAVADEDFLLAAALKERLQMCKGVLRRAVVSERSGTSPTSSLDTEAHAVRCCADTQVTGSFTQNFQSTCPNVWGATENLNGVYCKQATTWAQAQAHCAAVGARLCTQAELRADCTKGTGCSYDNEMTWSSDSSPPQAAPAVALFASGTGSGD